MFVKQREFEAWMRDVKGIADFGGPKSVVLEHFRGYMEDYNTATMPHEKCERRCRRVPVHPPRWSPASPPCIPCPHRAAPRYYDMGAWEAKVQAKQRQKMVERGAVDLQSDEAQKR